MKRAAFTLSFSMTAISVIALVFLAIALHRSQWIFAASMALCFASDFRITRKAAP